MTITLLTAVQRVSRRVGLDPTITSFSDNDETNDLVDDLNEAYEELLVVLPPETTYLMTDGSASIIAGTRTYSLPSDCRGYQLFEWSFTDTTDNNSTLQYATIDYVEELDPAYKTKSGVPSLLYLDGSDQIGLYPVPNANFTLQFKYGKSAGTRLSATSDTFILPDEWLKFVLKQAQAKYEMRKGYGSADNTQQLALEYLAQIQYDAWEMKPTYLFAEEF